MARAASMLALDMALWVLKDVPPKPPESDEVRRQPSAVAVAPSESALG